MAKLARQGDRAALEVPAWSPQWQTERLGVSRRDSMAEVVLDYQWKDLFASVWLVPVGADQKTIRALLNRPGAEILAAPPGEYKVAIDGWRPGDAAVEPLYRFEAREFERDYRYTLRFEPERAAPLIEYIGKVRERDAKVFAQPTPVVVDVLRPGSGDANSKTKAP
ncbi:MAG: hypothetical protein NTW86_09540 [Candidatus Sumerlaeota bacterium]|nr:hypothetical protein [Candidatus Sumerlaeota bacterium]